MFTERLKALIDNAAQLPLEIQEKLEAEIASAIDNALWDAELRDPANEEALIAWIEEARLDETVEIPSSCNPSTPPTETGEK